MGAVAGGYVGIARDEEVYPQCVVGKGIYIIAYRGEEARNLARAACAAKPLLPVVAAFGVKRVDVEEPVAREGYSGQCSVVHGALEHVDVLGVARHEVESPVPEHHTHRGARFAVCLLVGQIVIGGEAFVIAR